MAVLLNLKRLQLALDAGGKLLQIKFGFFRSEGKGVHRISQHGQGRALKETRLYVCPDEETKTLYLLTLGDKTTQKDDINFCTQWVGKFRQNKQP
jgi:hypothetical protein